jgi:hypothetical protein
MVEPDDLAQVLAEPAMLGEKSSAVLFALLSDLYRQELGFEEDPFRSLPFFATALGLIGTLLGYAGTQLPPWPRLVSQCGGATHKLLSTAQLPCAGGIWLTVLLFGGVFMFSLITLYYLALATLRGGYRRIGPESNLVDATRTLQAYYRAEGLAPDACDTAVALSMRSQLSDRLAETIMHNRQITLRRIRSRSRALAFLLWSLFFALAGIISLLSSIKLGNFQIPS